MRQNYSRIFARRIRPTYTKYSTLDLGSSLQHASEARRSTGEDGGWISINNSDLCPKGLFSIAPLPKSSIWPRPHQLYKRSAHAKTAEGVKLEARRAETGGTRFTTAGPGRARTTRMQGARVVRLPKPPLFLRGCRHHSLGTLRIFYNQFFAFTTNDVIEIAARQLLTTGLSVRRISPHTLVPKENPKCSNCIISNQSSNDKDCSSSYSPSGTSTPSRFKLALSRQTARKVSPSLSRPSNQGFSYRVESSNSAS